MLKKLGSKIKAAYNELFDVHGSFMIWYLPLLFTNAFFLPGNIMEGVWIGVVAEVLVLGLGLRLIYQTAEHAQWRKDRGLL